MSSDQSSSNLHVVMFPWFAFGHISPFVQLSNKLSSHGIQVSFFSASGNIARIKSTLKLSPEAKIIPLSIPHIEGLPPKLDSTADLTPAMGQLLIQALDLMQPQVNSLLTELKPHFVFFDFAQHWLPTMASQLGIKSLHFSVFSATPGAYFMVPARLRPSGDQKSITITDLVKPPHGLPSGDQTSITITDLVKPPHGFPVTSITSLKVFEAQDFVFVYKSFDGGPSAYDRVKKCLNDCTAILMKTCDEMEGSYVDSIRTQFQKPVLLTGTLVCESPPGELEEKWANWLGQFPPKSLIYCSFGSETFLNNDEIQEVALGLELTGLPFFLVLNFSAQVDGQAQLDRALPEGFLERVKDRGVVHTGWVQQQLILEHESVGCYVCHSGSNSVIEGLVNDCQLVLLPLKGDQFLNSKLISGDLKAGMEVNRREDDGHFGKEDIREAINIIMVEVEKEPGMSIRANQTKWREFLLNGHIQNKFISDLVEELKAMA